MGVILAGGLGWTEPLSEPVSLALELAPLALIAFAYQQRVRTLRRRGRPVPVARRASFVVGLALMLVAVASPVAHVAEELFAMHMVQHILLGDLAALALALGLTGTILAPVLRLKPVARLRAVAHPLIAFPLWMLDLYLWHLSALYQATLASPLVHASMHVLLLALGLAVWLPLVGPLPTPRWFSDWAKLGYVFGVRLAGAVLANVFIWSDTIFYPDYADGQRSWGIAPLSDQGAAGAILMVEGSILTVMVMAWLFLRAARRDEERQQLQDYAADRGLRLDDARAARAANADRSAELRERLTAGRRSRKPERGA